MGLNLGSIFSTGATELIKTVGNVVDNLVTTKAEKEQLNIELQKLIVEHEEKVADQAQSELDSYLKDVSDARSSNTTIQTSESASWLAKNTLYVLAYVVTLGFFGLLIYMITAEVPAGNKDVLNILLGSLGTAWVSIVSFFYGSSMSSHSKDNTIKGIVQNK